MTVANHNFASLHGVVSVLTLVKTMRLNAVRKVYAEHYIGPSAAAGLGPGEDGVLIPG